MDEREAQFRDFVAGSQRRLLNYAELLVGNRSLAEDLVQEALISAFAAWPRIHDGNPEAYVRRCVANGRTSWWRRPMSRERSLDLERGDAMPQADRTSEVDERVRVLNALKRLTARERTVIVLRYYIGLNERQIADEVSIAPGTVKSTASRAIAKLRDEFTPSEGVRM
jgi:RNA polymerase sigma-70 factor (sigma-E family)